MPDRSVDVLRAIDRVELPWRNGGGVTTEVVVSPGAETGAQAGAEDFAWRLSIATVDSNAPFSQFPGVDRVLLALSEHGLDLVDEGLPIHLDVFDSHTFAGENSVASVNVVSPTLDLNLMTRRGVVSGTLEPLAVSGHWSVSVSGTETVVVIVLRGTIALQDNAVFDNLLLGELDAVRLSGIATPATLSFGGLGQVAVARIRRAH